MAFTTTSGTPRRWSACSVVGHSSDSTKRARSGRQWSRKRPTAAGVSIGTNWWIAPARQADGRHLRRRDGAGGEENCQARAPRGGRSRAAPLPSRRRLPHAPRPARPAGLRRLARPSRSPRRDGSSLPRLSRREESRRRTGSTIRPHPAVEGERRLADETAQRPHPAGCQPPA